jgi:glutamine synthetase
MAVVDEGALRELEKQIEADNLDGLWIVFHDYSARACAKWVPRASVPSALRRGGVFARANLNFTIDDHQVDHPHFAADSGDMFAVPDPDTYSPLPYRPGIGRVLSHLCTEDGELWEGCPRGRLQRALDQLAERGFSAQAAFEPEFTLYTKQPDGGHKPVDRFAMYSVDRIDANADLLGRIDAALTAQGIRVIQMGTEYGAGQLEINLHHASPMKAADDLVTFRETTKAIARDAGIVASFMPKPFADAAGNGVHVHLSLWDANGNDDKSEGDGPLGLSRELAQFMAGVLAHAPALCGVSAPTVNSYKRLLPGSWAPGHIAWGSGNRAVLVRVPGSSRRRIEFRAGDHTANPYLFLASLIAAGIDGLDRQLDPGEPVEGDIGPMSIADVKRMGGRFLPRTASEALDAIEANATVMDALGPICGPELLRIKRHELSRYDTHVSEWEREVYLERV